MSSLENALLDKVLTIVIYEVGVDPEVILPTSEIRADLGADSLDLIDIIMAMEEEFGIEISDDDAWEMEDVADIVSFLENAGVELESDG